MSLDFNARIDYKYQGGDTIFSVPFSYINKSHIYVIINGDVDNPSQDFTWLSENQIQLNFTINVNDIISIRRDTPNKEKMVVFEDNNILDEETQNLAQDQVFNVVQEIEDANNNLINQMDEFTSQKEYVDKMLSDINNIQSLVNTVSDINAETQELVEGISSTYENLKNKVEQGVLATIPHNLFELIVYDKELTDEEQKGLGKQGEEISYNEYSDAYTALENEYNSGTENVFTDSETVVYYKEYEGDESGTFYLPSNSDLTEDTTVYSNTTCTTELGTVESIDNIEADKYTGSVTETFYTSKDTTIEVGTELYSNNILTDSIGTVESISNISAYKYKASLSGTFYISSDLNIRVGRIIYSDAGLSQQLGTITGIGSFKSDKYNISGLEDITEFYVPEGTIINTGTTLYKDAGCSVVLGTISKKGQILTNSSYCYNLTNTITFVSGAYIHNNFYTKTELPSNGSNLNIPCYIDKACLNLAGNQKVLSTSQGFLLTISSASGVNATVAGNYTLISSSTGTSSNYITIGDNTKQLSYYKQGTVSTEVINIDNGENENYSLESIEEGKYLKITGSALQKYDKIGTVTTGSITLNIDNESIEQSYIYNGIKTGAGIAFIYREASNGHKIVSALYENTINNLLTEEGSSEYYILDIDNKTFTLPTFDTSKNIYFCLGNTVITPSSIQGVTKEYLNNILENYVKIDNSILQDIQNILNNYNDTVGDIQQTLEDILGE